MAKHSLDEIYDKLLEIEGEIKNLETGEEMLISEEAELKNEESEEIKLLKKLHGKNQRKEYANIEDWKVNIWDSCPDKRTVETDNSFDFVCNKTGKSCRFIDCYRNKSS